MSSLLKFKIRVGIAAVLLFTASISSRALHETYLYEYKGASIVKLMGSNSSATGFQIIAKSGRQYTMTNRHVCDALSRNGKDIKWYQEEELGGSLKVLYRDKEADLCLLEPIPSIRPLKVARLAHKRESVYLVGHPAGRGLSFERGHLVEKTSIYLLNFCYDDPRFNCRFFYSSYHLNAISYGGNSGSPILDKYGSVVAVLFAGRRDQPTASHSVPLAEIKRVLEIN
jgi:S1-C subfamily serine protease